MNFEFCASDFGFAANPAFAGRLELRECNMMRKTGFMRHNNPFTMIEMIAVMIVIIILFGTVAGVAQYASRHGMDAAALSQIKAIENAMQMYKSDQGHFPQRVIAGAMDDPLYWEALTYTSYSLTDDCNAPYRPYIDYESLGMSSVTVTECHKYYLDPFGNTFWYQSPGLINNSTFDLWSRGVDGKHGGGGTVATDAQKFSAADLGDDINNWRR